MKTAGGEGEKMKRLVTAEDVIRAKESGHDIYIDGNTLVTAQAWDVAREKNIRIITGNEEKNSQKTTETTSEKNDSSCCTDQKSEKDVKCLTETVLSPEEIYCVLNAALKKGILTEKDISGMI